METDRRCCLWGKGRPSEGAGAATLMLPPLCSSVSEDVKVNSASQGPEPLLNLLEGEKLPSNNTTGLKRLIQESLCLG